MTNYYLSGLSRPQNHISARLLAGVFHLGRAMSVCVEITLNDDKTLTVGICEEPSADVDNSQPAGSIDEALKMARHLLMNPPADTDEASEPGGADDDSAPDADAASGGDASSAGGIGPDGSGLNTNMGAPSQSAGAAPSSDPKAIWDELAAQGQPAH